MTKEFGNTVSTWIEAHNMNVAEVSKQVGVSPLIMSEIIGGHVNPPPESSAKMAEIFHIGLDEQVVFLLQAAGHSQETIDKVAGRNAIAARAAQFAFDGVDQELDSFRGTSDEVLPLHIVDEVLVERMVNALEITATVKMGKGVILDRPKPNSTK